MVVCICPEADYLERQAEKNEEASSNEDAEESAVQSPSAHEDKPYVIVDEDDTFLVKSRDLSTVYGVLHPWWRSKVRFFTKVPCWKIECKQHTKCSTLVQEHDHSVESMIGLCAPWLVAGASIPKATGANADHKSLKPDPKARP